MPASEASQRFTRRATLRALLLVLTGAVGVQLSAVIAIGLFDDLGVLGTSSLRMLIAAALLLVIFRPRLQGRTRQEWTGIVLYGTAMAVMNVFIYLAIDRLPLGIAVTINFLGPCAIALAASRRVREALLALVALAGVALIAGFGGDFDALGVLFASLAGAALAGYTLLAGRIGRSDGGLQSLALSVAVGAVLTLPFSVPALPRVEPQHLLALFVSALIGTTLAFTVDTLAGKLISARVLGVLFALDPAIGTLFGVVLLGQVLSPASFVGVALVIAAGAGIVWSAGSRPSGAPSSSVLQP